ncbi:RDD family protein [Chromobacterium sp. CV08]|uniref:RDD family protein n=1 Tax=Chromobacterium sp. CV08 TaxID=3133274 RepID=UPI003DA87B96
MTIDSLSEPRIIAGFWRRLAAFFLDCLLLAVVGMALGYFFTQELARLGPWGQLLGFSIAAVYFAVQNSKMGGGQTVGKRLLKIRVVAKSGTPLSVPAAFARFLPLAAPWFLNSMLFSESVFFSYWFYALSIAVFGIGLPVVYLYVFNRKSRQSLGDLLVASYVVSTDASGHVLAPAVWKGHVAACALLAMASGIAPYFIKHFTSSEPFASLISITDAVDSQPWVMHAQVYKGKTFPISAKNNDEASTFLSVVAYSKDPDIANPQRATRLAKLALATDKTAAGLDVIQVMLAHGYDIGIASYWRSVHYVHSPAEWRTQ